MLLKVTLSNCAMSSAEKATEAVTATMVPATMGAADVGEELGAATVGQGVGETLGEVVVGER